MDNGFSGHHTATPAQRRQIGSDQADRIDRHRVLAVATEWNSSHGGLSTFNRELCCALAAAGAEVVCLVLRATAEERSDAAQKQVTLVTSAGSQGSTEEFALARKPALPSAFTPNIIIGHARVTGPSAKILQEDHYPVASRLHFVHTAPDEIEWHKLDRANDAGLRAEERTELELLLGRSAQRVVAVGPRLHHRLQNDLFPFDVSPLRLDPGFDGGEQPLDGRIPAGLWRILLFGRTEDAHLKGLDVASGAVGMAVARRQMRPEEIEFVVRGAPAGSTEQLRRQLRTWAQLPALNVLVRAYTTKAERLTADLRRSSLVLMPSRSEGFGLVGVEAILAGRPTLVGDSSGLGVLLTEVLPRDEASRIVVSMSGDDHEVTERWARAVEAVLRDREAAFRRAAEIRRFLAERKTWAAAVEELTTVLAIDSGLDTMPAAKATIGATSEIADIQPSRYLTAAERTLIAQALLRTDALSDPRDRSGLFTALEQRIGQQLKDDADADPERHLFNVVTSCQRVPGSLRMLIQIVGESAVHTSAVTEAEQLLARLEKTPLLTTNDRIGLTNALKGIVPEVVSAASSDLLQAGNLDSDIDTAQVIGWLEMAPPHGARPPILIFADRVAHQVGHHESKNLHEWIDSAGGVLGLDQDDLRFLCVDSRKWFADGPRPPILSVPIEANAADGSNSTITDNYGDSVTATTVTHAGEIATKPVESERTRQIRGNIPIRNPDFTGRGQLLNQLRATLNAMSKAAVLPRALHGLGGVGKTQLAIEYVYRFGEDYDLIWWIAAEHPSLALASLATLCEELGLPPNVDQKQTAETVLRTLSTTTLRWLLIFDNADDPDDIVPLVPTAGGHVIITSRNQTWANVGDAIEVNVFQRTESVQLLRKRGETISFDDADRLAERLGDLPLALDQAASWQSATGMPVQEYLELFNSHVRELLSEGKPAWYPTTVAAFVTIAAERLRSIAPAAAQLLHLFAFLGAEPISVGLLRRAREAAISEPLRSVLRAPIQLNRAIRELRRHGLAKVDPDQRIHVHRLVQMVLREELDEPLTLESQANVQRILASANPTAPDELSRYARVYQEIGPHIVSAGLVDSDVDGARQVVLDHIRYLYVIGDYESSRRLAETALASWSTASGSGVGAEGELTLIVTRHLANALRDLGHKDEARVLDEDIYERLQRSPEFGPDHEHTLATAMSVAVDLRVAGDYRKAIAVDRPNYERHRAVYGDEDELTLRARRNLAVNLRILGDFEAALEIDKQLVRQWEQTVEEGDHRYLICVVSLAHDLYGRGRYKESLERLSQAYPLFRDARGSRSVPVLWTARAYGAALRKSGRYREALSWMRDNYRECHARLGANHEHTLTATMGYANTLRVAGELGEARAVATDGVERYRRTFGDRHPLTLAATTNLAIVLRALSEHREARRLDEVGLEEMTRALGADHGYTLCVANNLSNDLVLSHDLAAARRLSERTWKVSQSVRGNDHPYTLGCAVNAALDLQATGEEVAGRALLDQTVSALGEVLGPEHPETIDAGRFKRAESDIEPPPT